MELILNEQEREYLKELLETAQTEAYRELHHTDLHDYRKMVKEKIDLLETLRARLENKAESVPA
jgi:hypothetical protein